MLSLNSKGARLLCKNGRRNRTRKRNLKRFFFDRFQRHIAMNAHFQNEHIGQTANDDEKKICRLCSHVAVDIFSVRQHLLKQVANHIKLLLRHRRCGDKLRLHHVPFDCQSLPANDQQLPKQGSLTERDGSVQLTSKLLQVVL
jgi:hypothetical protein